MNTLDLAKEIAISRLEKKRVMYVITGYYRLLPDFDCYELNIDPERLFDTNGEKVDYTKHFIEQLNKVKRNFTAVYFTNNPYVLTFLNNCILAGQLNAKGFPKVEVPVKSFHTDSNSEFVTPLLLLPNGDVAIGVTEMDDKPMIMTFCKSDLMQVLWW